MIQIKNKDYLSLTEDSRKARHFRIARFLQEKSQGTLWRNKDNVFLDAFLKEMVIKHFNKGDTIYREFEIPEFFYIVHTGILAIEKQVEVEYSNLWPVAAKKWTHM